jgi:hypothetical protein
MKRIIVPICVLLLTTPALAQTRSRTTTTRRPASTRNAKSPADDSVAQARTTGATKVADQIKNLSRFVYLLGGVAKGIEQIDEAAQKNEASPTALQQNDQNKATVKNSLRNVREGLDALEIYFRSTPGLEGYYRTLVGSASGAASAEELAAAGRFDQAGRTLLGVVNRLTDVLLQMR